MRERRYVVPYKFTGWVACILTICMLLLVPERVTTLLASSQVRGMLVSGFVIGVLSTCTLDVLIDRINKAYDRRCQAYELLEDKDA